MSNLPLDRTVRLRAMWCSLSGLTGVLIRLLTYILRLVMPGLFYPGVLLLSVLISIIFWQINRRLHPFVDLVGKASINLTITYLCPIIVMMFIDSILINYHLYIDRALVLFFVPMLITHNIITSWTAIAAIEGKVYSYRWKFNFFK